MLKLVAPNGISQVKGFAVETLRELETFKRTAVDTSSMPSNDQTEVESKISKEIRKTGNVLIGFPAFLLGKPGRCFAYVAA
jgi:hypothetical protein